MPSSQEYPYVKAREQRKLREQQELHELYCKFLGIDVRMHKIYKPKDNVDIFCKGKSVKTMVDFGYV